MSEKKRVFRIAGGGHVERRDTSTRTPPAPTAKPVPMPPYDANAALAERIDTARKTGRVEK